MKILLLISGLLFSGGVFAEPSDWVKKQLIDKPISYMTYGLYRCTENFAKDQSEINPPTCYYDYAENRLIFLQTDTSVQDTFSSTDTNKALQYCKDNLSFSLRRFTRGRDRMFPILYLVGFSPSGYGYADDPDRREKLREFSRRGLVRYQIIHKETDTDDTVWLCEWKFNQQEPSI
ncbi:hypothetical protein N9L78_02850, partial [Gammaproteobacteria bacterium]|nr:hypothetical protein [Gammaproteobacteria bacterium]